MIEYSIIIPVYKVEEHIHQCIDSVIEEIPENSEIILVDDGSPDSCPMICDEYARKDNRIKVIHKDNSGLSGARNAGLSVSTGKFIFFLDSDDYLKANYFKKLLSNKADLVIGSFAAFYTSNISDYSLNLAKKSYYSITEYLLDFNHYFPVTFNTAWGKLYCRDIIENNELRFREDLFMVEDILFNIEYYKKCSSIVYEPAAILMYRQGDGTLSKKSNENLFSWYQESYKQLKLLLQDKDVFSGRNRDKYYQSLFGNTMECLENAANGGGNGLKKLCDSICKDEDVILSADYSKSIKVRPIAMAIKKRNPIRLRIYARFYVLAVRIKAFGRKIL